jgi:sugar phosphate permease
MLADEDGLSWGPPTGVRWRIVALLMAISFVNHFNRICMPVAGGRIMEQYAITPTRMGWVYSALLIAYTVGMTPGGWFADRFGARRALVAMGFGSALFVALTGAVGHPAMAAGLVVPALVAIRGLMGGVMAPLYPAAGRVVSHWIPFHHRGLANALVTGCAPLGVACAYPVFARLIDAFGWPAAFLITGTCTAALAGAWAAYGRNDPKAHRAVNRAEWELITADQPQRAALADAGRVPAQPSASARDVMRNRSLWLLTVSYAAVGYVEYLLFYWSEYYFQQVLEFGASQSRIAAMIPPLTMAGAMPLGGWLSDRLVGRIGYRRGRATVALGGMVGCGTLLAAGPATPEPVAIVACFALALGAIGLCEGPAWATAIDLGGAHGGASAAIANTGGNAGGFLAPVVTPWVGAALTPWLGRALGWAWGLRLGSLICLLGAGLWLAIDAGERARGVDEAPIEP